MSRGDLALIRQAANQDWHASRATRRRIPSVIFERLGKMEPDAPYDGREVRWQLAAARTIAAMNGANIRIVKRALRTAAAARRMAPKHPAS